MMKTRTFGSARGIPRANYPGDINSDYICSICLEVLNDPYQCKNGHLNCKDCWNDLILKSSSLAGCTLCRTTVFNMSDLSKCLIVNKQIALLHVKCECQWNINASKSGCVWTGTIAERDERVCEFLFTECVHNGCFQKVKIESLKYHVANCPKRPKRCVDCNMVFPTEDFKEGRHTEVCVSPTRLVSCICGVFIKDLDLAVHKSVECPMTLIQCPIFRDLDTCVETCNGTIKRGASTLHLGPNATLIRALYMRNQVLQNNHQCVRKFPLLFLPLVLQLFVL